MKKIGSFLLYISILLFLLVDAPSIFFLKVFTASAGIVMMSIGYMRDEQSESN